MLKALKFLPHLFKTEPNTSDANLYSPNRVLHLDTVENRYKADEEDDVIEIDGV